MTPATSILELYKNLTPGRILTIEDAAYRVPLYEQLLDEIRFKIMYDENPRQTIFIAGQYGSGKSTALNYLAYDMDKGQNHEGIHGQFAVIPIHTRDLLDLNDVDIYQLLLVISHSLVQGHDKLEKEFEKEIKKTYEVIQGRLSHVVEKGGSGSGEAGVGLSMGTDTGDKKSPFDILNPVSFFAKVFNVKGDFFAKIKTDAYIRKVIKETFAVNIGDLLELTNKIIHRYKEWVSGGKEVLLIIHDLDHIRRKNLIEPLFIDNRNNIDRIACKKVLSVPGYLFTEGVFTGNIKFIGLKINPNPIPEAAQRDIESIAKNRNLLKEIVRRRIAKDVNLINDEALEKAVDLSGGLMRQFVSIVHNAARKVAMVNGNTISVNDIEDGALEEGQNLTRSINSNDKIEVLEQVRTTYKPAAEGGQLLVELLLGGQVIIYQNSPDWYDLNPLVNKAVESYAKALPKKEN